METHPSQVNVQSRYHNLLWVFGCETNETMVLHDQPLSCRHERWAMQPVQLRHLLHEDSLSQDGAHQIDAENARVIPVMAQYLTHRNATCLGDKVWPFLLRIHQYNIR